MTSLPRTLTPWLNYIRFTITAVAVCLLMPSIAVCDYPVVDGVPGLPQATFITVYPDDKDPNLYYFVPTTVAIYQRDGGALAFGVQYWGLTGLDPAGSGGAFTVTVVPAWDKAKIKEVQDAILTKSPNARFAVPNLISAKMELIVNRAYFDKNQDTTAPVSTVGNTVDATQAFSITLTNVGARAFAQGVAPDSDVVAARYTYRFRGVGKRLHAKITVYDRRVYDHFKATASGSAWWGLVRSSWTVDWQKLVKEGSIKLEILSGGVSDDDEYMLEVFKQLVDAKIGGEGMFKPELKPNGVNTDTGGGLMGWGFSSSTAWEHLEETDNYSFEIDKQSLEEREFSTGVSFSAVCAKHPDNFVDLTSGGKCIDLTKFKQVVQLQADCLDTKTSRLDSLLERKLISQDVWQSERAKALDSPCYSGTPNMLVDPLFVRATQGRAANIKELPEQQFLLPLPQHQFGTTKISAPSDKK